MQKNPASELQDPIMRDNPRQPYIASLTGLRGLAAFSVYLYHYNYFNPGIRLDLSIPLLGKVLLTPFAFGFTGVDLFFVLSGFLLTLPFALAARSNSDYPVISAYFKRRLLRVFPAYYAQLSIILLVGTWFVTWKPLSGTTLVAHLAMFFNIGPYPVQQMVGVWWTLPIEMSFYLLLPLLAIFMRPGRWLYFLVTCIILSLAYRYWAVVHFSTDSNLIRVAASHLPGSLPEFLLGSSAAILVQFCRLNSIKPPSPTMLDLMFVVSSVCVFFWLWAIVLPNGSLFWWGHWSMMAEPVVLGLVLSVIVISLYWGSRIGSFLCANRPVYYLGLISYSLYLWHFVVLQQLDEHLGEAFNELAGLPKFLISTVLVILISALSYFLFERPFFKLRTKDKTPVK